MSEYKFIGLYISQFLSRTHSLTDSLPITTLGKVWENVYCYVTEVGRVVILQSSAAASNSCKLKHDYICNMI